jgi:hypothetical protein
VRVGELGRGLGFPGESLSDVPLKGELGGQHLDGHPALEAFVAGAVDHAHPATADLALNGVCVSQGLTEPGRQGLIGGVGHGWGRGFKPVRARGRRAAGVEPRSMAPNLYPRTASGN